MNKITTLRDDHEVVDYESYSQHLVTVFYNRVTALSSSEYLSKFGLGSIEMSVLAAIASHPAYKAADICKLISINKAAVSRAITKLENSGHINGTTLKPTGKQKRWTLSTEGWHIHNQFIDNVKVRHQCVTQGIDEAELYTFNQTLRKLISNVEQLMNQ